MCLAVPMKVIETRPDEMAVVESGGVSMEISTQFLEDLQPGEYVLVHAGFAIERLDEDAAQETLAALNELMRALDDQST